MKLYKLLTPKKAGFQLELAAPLVPLAPEVMIPALAGAALSALLLETIKRTRTQPLVETVKPTGALPNIAIQTPTEFVSTLLSMPTPPTPEELQTALETIKAPTDWVNQVLVLYKREFPKVKLVHGLKEQKKAIGRYLMPKDESVEPLIEIDKLAVKKGVADIVLAHEIAHWLYSLFSDTPNNENIAKAAEMWYAGEIPMPEGLKRLAQRAGYSEEELRKAIYNTINSLINKD